MANKIKSIHVSAKCSDCCYVEVLDKDGNEVTPSKSDYVPQFLDIPDKEEDSGCGDYVIMTIDFETGKIKNWNKVKSLVQKYVKTDGKIFE